MRRWFQTSLMLAALVTLVTLTSLLAACGESEPVVGPSAEPSDDVSGPRTGQQIFAATCAACHGADGEGAENWMVRDEDGRLPPPPLNGEGHTWHHSDGVLYGIVSNGGAGIGFGSNMPAFKDELSRDEIVAVLEYVKTLWRGKEIDGFSIVESQREISQTDPYPDPGD